MFTKVLSTFLVASLLFGMTGCAIEFATPGPAYKTEFSSTECPFTLPEGLVEGQDVECGMLSVPEDRENPQQRTLQLAVAIFHPKGGASQPDPVIYLVGGPGASVFKMLASSFEVVFSPMLEAGRDLVLFDQRGVGYSVPALDCPEATQLGLELLDWKMDGQLLTNSEMDALFDQAFRSCYDQLSFIADLGMYNTLSSAADVNDLRIALDYEKVNLWGSSYGTRLALEVMRVYPEGIRSVILDAVYPPEADMYLDTPSSLDRSLTMLADACAADPACDSAYPDLRTVFFQAVADLESEPVSLTVTDPETYQVRSMLFDGDTLFGLVFTLLYEAQALPFLPWLIYNAYSGELDILGRIYGQVLAMSEVSSRGMTFSVQCHEEISFSTQEDFEAVLQEYPDLAPYLEESIVGGWGYEVCDFWDAGHAKSQENEPVSSDLPALILQGDFDPITPPDWSRNASETLTNSHYFLFPNSSHGSLNSECAWGMAVAFLQDPGLSPDAACIIELEPLTFYVP